MRSANPFAVRTIVALLAISAALGLLDAWSQRDAMNPDGVCYLDLGDDFNRGDWSNFVNAHWGPLYPILLGTALRLGQPTIETEFPLVHALNFLIYLYAVACGWAFIRQLVLLRRQQTTDSLVVEETASRERMLIWTLFFLFWAVALRQIGLGFVTPDMLFFGTVLLCLALVLSIRNRSTPALGLCVVLGLCAGIGYLAKAPFLPLFPFLVLGVALAPDIPSRRVSLARIGAALAAFLIIAVPWIACLYHKYGIVTFSESGNLNRLWEVSRSAPLVHWQGGADSGTPTHPTRIILDSPRAYEFGEPVSGTYPPWKDPVYWMAAAQPRLDVVGHLRRLGESAVRLAVEIFRSGFLVLVIVFLSVRDTAKSRLKDSAPPIWPVLLLSAAGLLMFALVLVENRYIAAFWFALFAGLVWIVYLPRAPRSGIKDRLPLLVAACCCLTAVVPIVILSGWVAFRGTEAAPAPNVLPPAYHLRAATELRRFGVEPETPIAVVSGAGTHEFGFNEYWARLCRVHIVAEVPNSQPDLLRRPESFRRALAACRKAGARFAIVTPEGTAPEGEGTEIPGTRMRLFDLRGAPSPSER